MEPTMTGHAVLLADGHDLVRRGIRALLEGTQYMVAGEAADGLSAIERADSVNPSLVVMELDLRGRTGVQVIARLRESHPIARILVLTSHEEDGFVRSAFSAGAAGYVLKQSPLDVLREAIDAVAAGLDYIDPRLSASLRVVAAAGRVSHGELNHRERRAVALVAMGYSNKEIAALMDVSVKTAETYRARAAEKLGLRNRPDLVRYALGQGWLDEQAMGA
jgi:DNA-binding NarL/FixJ family response regulator